MHQSTFSTSHDVGSFEFFWMGHSNANLHAYLACQGQCLSPTSNDRKDPFQCRQHDSEAHTDPRLRRKFHPVVASKFSLHMQVATAAAVETKAASTKAAVETKSKWRHWQPEKSKSDNVQFSNCLLTLQCWHLRVTSYCSKKAPGFNFLICCTRLAIKRKSKRKHLVWHCDHPLYLVFSLLLKHTFQLSFKTFIWDFEKCILKKVSSIHTFHAKSCLQLSFQTFQM